MSWVELTDIEGVEVVILPHGKSIHLQQGVTGVTPNPEVGGTTQREVWHAEIVVGQWETRLHAGVCTKEACAVDVIACAEGSLHGNDMFFNTLLG